MSDADRPAGPPADPPRRSRRPRAGISFQLGSDPASAEGGSVVEARAQLGPARFELRLGRLTREESRQQTRARLLDAAADVFNRLGYHGTSLESVAEAAGFTKGAVYSNFATKAELFVALLDRYTQERLAAQDAALRDGSIEQLADGAGALIRHEAAEARDWDLLQIEFWLAAMRDPAIRRLLVEGNERLYRESGERIAAKLAAADLTPPFTGLELARVLSALGSGLLLQAYLDPDAVDPDLLGRAIRVLVGLPPATT